MDAKRVKINSQEAFRVTKSRLDGVDLTDHMACHLAAIHPGDDKWSFGSICRYENGKMSDRRRRLPHLLALARQRAAEGGDLYVSLNTFRSGQSRDTSNLGNLCNLYVDIDYYKAEKTAEMSGFEVMELVFDRLQDLGRPAPTLVVDSGRGLQMIWTMTPLPSYAKPRWDACQKQLVEDLADLGADPIAKDASRVFRLAGTFNSKSRRKTSLLHFDQKNAGFPRDFNDLANAILPFSRAEIRSLRAEATRRGKPVRLTKDGSSRVIPKLDASTYGDALLSDVFKLIAHRYPNGQLPAGDRDKYFFIAALAAAWHSHPGAIESVIVEMATGMSDWSEKATKQAIKCVLDRSQAALAGQRIEFNGKLVDPRYKMKAATVIEWLQITDAEMREADLRLAVTDDLKKERRRQAAEAKRRSEGRRTQAEVSTDRMRLARQVERLIDAGRTQTEVAKALRLRQGQVSRLLKAARAAGPADPITQVFDAMPAEWRGLRLIVQEILPLAAPTSPPGRRSSA